jgi:hypothetical protein
MEKCGNKALMLKFIDRCGRNLDHCVAPTKTRNRYTASRGNRVILTLATVARDPTFCMLNMTALASKHVQIALCTCLGWYTVH